MSALDAVADLPQDGYEPGRPIRAQVAIVRTPDDRERPLLQSIRSTRRRARAAVFYYNQRKKPENQVEFLRFARVYIQVVEDEPRAA